MFTHVLQIHERNVNPRCINAVYGQVQRANLRTQVVVVTRQCIPLILCIYGFLAKQRSRTCEKCDLQDIDLYAHTIKMLATIYGQNYAVLFGDGLAEEMEIKKNIRDKNKINNASCISSHVSQQIIDSEYYFSKNILDL